MPRPSTALSLHQEFANEWVAFYHGKVVSHGSTLEEVLHEMSERAIIQFLDPDPPVIVI